METPGKVTRILFAVLRLVIIAAAGLLLYTFLYTISLEQINHGNIIGTAYCIAVILLAAFYPLLAKKKPLKTAALVCSGLLAAFAVYCAVISGFIISEMVSGEEKAVAASTDGTPQTVIVLGCQVLGTEPSRMLTLRLEKAKEYLDSHPNAVCIVTGGKGEKELITEAEAMKTYLLAHGMSESRIYSDDKSSNTAENIEFASKIIAENGLPENVVVVSECYHIFRGVRQARLAGLYASGIYPDPGPVIRTMPSYWLREIFAITRDLVVGIIS